MENFRKQCLEQRPIYNWDSLPSFQQKSVTSIHLVKRSILICFNQDFLEKKLDHLRTGVTKINDQPVNS